MNFKKPTIWLAEKALKNEMERQALVSKINTSLVLGQRFGDADPNYGNICNLVNELQGLSNPNLNSTVIFYKKHTLNTFKIIAAV